MEGSILGAVANGISVRNSFQIQILWKVARPERPFQPSNRFENSHRAWHWYCCTLSKISTRFSNLTIGYGQLRFHVPISYISHIATCLLYIAGNTLGDTLVALGAVWLLKKDTVLSLYESALWKQHGYDRLVSTVQFPKPSLYWNETQTIMLVWYLTQFYHAYSLGTMMNLRSLLTRKCHFDEILSTGCTDLWLPWNHRNSKMTRTWIYP